MKKISSAISVFMLGAATALLAPISGKADVAGMSASELSSAPAAENSGKVLAAYFTWPEPDGVDASSGVSRIIADGKLYGNTEYVARIIAGAVGGDLFAIETWLQRQGMLKN